MRVTLAEPLAAMWGQEAFLQPSGQVACDTRNIAASVFPGTLDPQMTSSYVFQTLVLSPCPAPQTWWPGSGWWPGRGAMNWR